MPQMKPPPLPIKQRISQKLRASQDDVFNFWNYLRLRKNYKNSTESSVPFGQLSPAVTSYITIRQAVSYSADFIWMLLALPLMLFSSCRTQSWLSCQVSLATTNLWQFLGLCLSQPWHLPRELVRYSVEHPSIWVCLICSHDRVSLHIFSKSLQMQCFALLRASEEGCMSIHLVTGAITFDHLAKVLSCWASPSLSHLLQCERVPAFPLTMWK